MRIGYGRVSTAEQNLDHQRDALERAGVAVDQVYVDVISGSKSKRPQLDIVRRVLRQGDTLVVTRLDRLSRSLTDLVNTLNDLRTRGVELLVLEQGIDTTTPEGRFTYHIIGAFGEFQREMILGNTRDGLAAARARGRVGGRKRKLTPRQARLVREMYDEVGADGKRAHTVAAIAREVRVSRATIYNYLQREQAAAA